MMISYLDIDLSRQAISNYNIPDLFHLIGFALSGTGLQVDDFGDSVAEKDVVVAFNAFLKSRPLEKLQHAGKRDICVSVAPQNLVEKFICACHGAIKRRSLARNYENRQARRQAWPKSEGEVLESLHVQQPIVGVGDAAVLDGGELGLELAGEGGG